MSPDIQHAILTAAGALLVAVLNEARAYVRAKQADEDRRRLAEAAANNARAGSEEKKTP